MEAKDYLVDHWMKNKIWTHLKWPKHQKRFRECASRCIGETFVDVGCGIGHSTYYMAGYKIGRWTGIEFYEEAIKKAKELFKNSGIYFHYIPAVVDLKKFHEQYDSVVCSEVIEHVENDQELIEGLLFIAKKRIVITTPNRSVNDPGHLRLYDLGMLKNLIQPLISGIGKVDIDSIDNFFFITVTKN